VRLQTLLSLQKEDAALMILAYFAMK